MMWRGELLIWRQAGLLCSIGPAAAPEEPSRPLTMTSQMQSGSGPGRACVSVCVCVCVCKVGVKGDAYHRDKHRIASVGPPGRTKCTLPVCSMCPLTDN